MCASEICVNPSAYIYLVDEWGRSETGQQPETLCPVELAWGWALDSWVVGLETWKAGIQK